MKYLQLTKGNSLIARYVNNYMMYFISLKLFKCTLLNILMDGGIDIAISPILL